MDPSTMLEIAIAARDAARKPDVAGVVVTHGTTTLEYTAFLVHLIRHGSYTVVITVRMPGLTIKDADGPSNLRAASPVTASDEACSSSVPSSYSAAAYWRAGVRRPTGQRFDAFDDLAGDVEQGPGRGHDRRSTPIPGPLSVGKLDPASPLSRRCRAWMALIELRRRRTRPRDRRSPAPRDTTGMFAAVSSGRPPSRWSSRPRAPFD